MAPTHALRKTPAAVVLNALEALTEKKVPARKRQDIHHLDPLLHSPRQNRLLAALSEKEYETLLSHLELVRLPLGWSVYGACDLQKYLYFITEGVVSRFYVMENGSTAEFAATGNEGVIGLATFLGGNSTPSQSSVVSAGYAYRMRGDRVRGDISLGGRLPHLLLRYAMALTIQAGQTAACNRHHTVRQQLCSLLLASTDRLHSNEVKITQDLIADELGVRRESVTEAMGHMQGLGVIRHSRGRVVVLNRSALEAAACECYAVMKHEQERVASSCSQGHGH